jgi:hypothetical protein
VGRARALYVIEHPFAVIPTQGRYHVLIHLGDDPSGRALEVGVLEVAVGQLVVIHAMDLRPKYRAAYEAGRNQR